MARVYNFSAGPSMLPETVLKTAQAELLDYHGSGMSVMEMSHRSKWFDEIITNTEAAMRRVLNIPDNYKVGFFQGGATQQFAMVPLNFMTTGTADYLVTGNFSKKAAEEATTENKPLFDAMQAALGDKIKAVKVSTRLKDHPVCLSSDGPVSIEMEKVLRKQPGSEGVKSEKVLELNAKHPVFAVLKAAQQAGDTDKLNKYASILYNQALLIEGMPVDDPVAYAEAVCELMK